MPIKAKALKLFGLFKIYANISEYRTSNSNKQLVGYPTISAQRSPGHCSHVPSFQLMFQLFLERAAAAARPRPHKSTLHDESPKPKPAPRATRCCTSHQPPPDSAMKNAPPCLDARCESIIGIVTQK